MSSPAVVFRADASPIIGAGHVARCAALADRLRERGSATVFVCRDLPASFGKDLEERGHVVCRFPPRDRDELTQFEDAAITRALLERWMPLDCVVVDHYDLDVTWEREMRSTTRRILVVDDFSNRSHDCDLLLNQNCQVETEEDPYTGLVPAATQRFIGPKYALLHSQFSLERMQARSRDGTVRRVFICFGGMTPAGFSVAALSALAPFATKLERIDVILGHAVTDLKNAAAHCKKLGLSSVSLHHHVRNVAALLGKADLAIGAGGTMSWERACLGVPTLAFGIAANQRDVIAALIDRGIVLGSPDMALPDPAAIASWLECVIRNAPLLRGLSRRSAHLVDGRGADRVADMLLPLSVTFRGASLEDTEAIYTWRNDPAVRAASMDPSELPFDMHADWMRRTLDDASKILLVAEREGAPVGVVRFDLSPPDAVISVYAVRPRRDGHGGLVSSSTRWLKEHHPEIRRIVARVRPENAASLAAFRRAGYHEGEQILVHEVAPPHDIGPRTQ